MLPRILFLLLMLISGVSSASLLSQHTLPAQYMQTTEDAAIWAQVGNSVINVGNVNRLFPNGGTVGVDELVAAGAVRKNSLVKILGDGKLTVKVDLTAHKFSGSAREKISAAGGSVTEL